MSDPQPPVGEPIEPSDEPRGVDDVVGSAHEGLADAAAAGEGAVSGDARKKTDAEPAEAQTEAASAEPAPAEPAHTEPAPAEAEPAAHEPARESAETAPAQKAEPEPDPWSSPEAQSLNYTPEYTSPETVAATAGAVPVTASEPAAAAETVAVAPIAQTPTPQQIFVQAPEAPRPRGNRAAAGGIGLLAAVAFGVLYLGVWSANWFLTGHAASNAYVQALLRVLESWTLWTALVVFYLGFWLLGAFINRGRWAHWAIWGVLVGFVAWGGYALGQILSVTHGQFWLLTSADMKQLNASVLFLSLMGVASFIIARELTVWFGAWVAARGRRVTKHNLEAQREYEHTLESGPQLVVP